MLLYFDQPDAFCTYSGPKLTSPFAGLYSAPMLLTHKLTNRSRTKTPARLSFSSKPAAASSRYVPYKTRALSDILAEPDATQTSAASSDRCPRGARTILPTVGKAPYRECNACTYSCLLPLLILHSTLPASGTSSYARCCVDRRKFNRPSSFT